MTDAYCPKCGQDLPTGMALCHGCREDHYRRSPLSEAERTALYRERRAEAKAIAAGTKIRRPNTTPAEYWFETTVRSPFRAV